MTTSNIKKILIPIDISNPSEIVQEHAIFMAKKTNAEIVLITVLEGPTVVVGEKYFDVSAYEHPEFGEIITEGTKKHLEKYKTELEGKGIKNVSYIIENGKPYKKILEAAEKIKPDIIIIGTPDISDNTEIAVGSNTLKVVSKALCPVLSVRKNAPQNGFKNILLPFHDKPHSRESLEYAIHLAKIYGAVIHVLGFSYDTSEDGIKKIRLEGEQIKHILENRSVENTLEVITGEYEAKVIYDYAKKNNADIIAIMVDLHRMSVSEYIIGPVLQQLINHSQIPVLSIHPRVNYNLLEVDIEPINAVDWKFWN
ncbi:MAG: universal stress protein [Bacteroidia bacterium]